MSGLSLTAAPPQENPPSAAGSQPTRPTPEKKRHSTIMGGMMGSLRVIELQLVAFILVFSASGLVSLVDLLFPLLVTLYCAFLSRLAFPLTASSGRQVNAEIFTGGPAFRAYVVAGTTVGLFLPLAYVLGGFAREDEGAVRAATPHLFMLSCQILTENVVAGAGILSPPVRAMEPIIYTGRRLFVVADWVRDVWLQKSLPDDAGVQDVGWLWFGRVLSAANLAYFTFNLFGFLIPCFLPRAFEIYFREKGEVFAKMAEDKPTAAAAVSPDQPEPAKLPDSKKSD